MFGAVFGVSLETAPIELIVLLVLLRFCLHRLVLLYSPRMVSKFELALPVLRRTALDLRRNMREGNEGDS